MIARPRKRWIFSYVFKIRFGCHIFFYVRKIRPAKCLKIVLYTAVILLFLSGFYKFNFSVKFSTKRRVFYNLNFYANLLDRARLMNTNYEGDYELMSNNSAPENNDTEEYYNGRIGTVKNVAFQRLIVNRNKCPAKSPHLKGKSPVVHPHHVKYVTQNMTKFWMDLLEANTDVRLGGWYKPPNCEPEHRVAIIIPYRNRTKHLALLLQQLNVILKRQLISYHVFVAEQYGNDTFNKARLMNTAFEVIHKNRFKNQFNCFIFHDVDLLPENDRNLYACGDTPIHLSPAVDSLRYILPYPELVGGVFAIRPEQFEQVNGYSNLYWGWGSVPYKMFSTDMFLALSYVPLQNGFHLLWTAKERYKRDGLAQLHSFNCTLISLNLTSLYTHLLVNVGGTPESSFSLLTD